MIKFKVSKDGIILFLGMTTIPFLEKAGERTYLICTSIILLTISIMRLNQRKYFKHKIYTLAIPVIMIITRKARKAFKP